MEKEFVPFELAVKMKELGFESHSFFGGWDSDIKWHWHPDSDIILDAPLWQQAFDWFREVHNHHVNITRTYGSEFMPYIDGQELNYDNAKYQWIYHTHEEARTACLEKLIEIVSA